MKRLVAGGIALALAGAGAVAWASPLSAQESDIPLGEASLAPIPVEPGATVTVSSADVCPAGDDGEPGWFAWFVRDASNNDVLTNVEFVPPDEVPDDVEDPNNVVDLEALEVPGDDGSWQITFTAPEAEGEYAFDGFCVQDGEAISDEVPVVPVVPNPCDDPNFPGDDVVFPPGDEIPPPDDTTTTSTTEPEDPGALNDVVVPTRDELCGEQDEETGQWQLNPCDDAEFAELNGSLCETVNLCEIEPDNAACEAQFFGLVDTLQYFEQFTVQSAEAPPAVAVPGEPGFTG